jgi:hypothetical protein
MKTTIRLPDNLVSKARRKAAEEGLTLSSLIEEALKMSLAEPKPVRRKTRVRLPISRASGGTLPGADLNRSGDLLDHMEA